jgi:single stranded DNA-binding protein
MTKNSINVAILTGYVGKIETKQLKNGNDFVIVSIATLKNYKDSTGIAHEQTTWHDVCCFGKLVESITASGLASGDLVSVQGQIQHRRVEATGDRPGYGMYSIFANDVSIIHKAPVKNDQQSAQYKPQVHTQPPQYGHSQQPHDVPF